MTGDRRARNSARGYGLHTGRVVEVSDRGKEIRPLYGRHELHVGRFRHRHVEILRPAYSAMMTGANGRKGSRFLMRLTRSFVFGSARIGHEGPVAEGARPELGAPVCDADHLAIQQRRRDLRVGEGSVDVLAEVGVNPIQLPRVRKRPPRRATNPRRLDSA